MEGIILQHNCFECGFRGEVYAEGRKIKCPKCGTINDFWLKNETPPKNHC
jgi:phage FluMu protein Com